MSFRIGLFGLDKLMNIDRTVSLFEQPLQVETAKKTPGAGQLFFCLLSWAFVAHSGHVHSRRAGVSSLSIVGTVSIAAGPAGHMPDNFLLYTNNC